MIVSYSLSGFRTKRVSGGLSATSGLQVVRALQAALADFFSSKKCRLARPALEAFLRTVPAAAPAVLPDVIAAAGGARTTFLRTQALALLSAMLRPPKVRVIAYSIAH